MVITINKPSKITFDRTTNFRNLSLKVRNRNRKFKFDDGKQTKQIQT